MRKLVCTPIANTIYWATVNEKKGTMNTETRIDVTDNALDVVFEHITSLEGFNKDGFAAYEFPRKDGDAPAMLCAFDSRKVTFVNKEELLDCKDELEFTRKFIHEHGLEFALASAWNNYKANI